MTTGAYDRNDPREQQCIHCGLFYSPQGIHNHQRGCTLKDHDTMIQPLENDEPVPDTSPEHEDGEVIDTETEQPEPDEQVAATDGGNPALDAPEPRTDGGQETEAQSDDPVCPDCGSNRYAVVDEHRDSLPGWAHEYDIICADCREVYDRE
jgi:hypothetical protein